MKKTLCSLMTGFVLVTLLSAANLFGQKAREPKGISGASANRRATEKIIREYLLKNPELIRDAMQALQTKEDKQKNLVTAGNMKKFKSEIYSDADSPVIGNADGDVTVVVFYDYFCGYCRKTLPGLGDLIAGDSSVKIIYKEFPILGPQSFLAARAALAAARQGKFEAFHRVMLDTESPTDENIKAIAEKLGLDYAKLEKDMNDPKINDAIARNVKLAESLNINGTPAYLVGDQFIPGAVETGNLAKIVADERAKRASAENVKTATGQK